MHLKAGVTGGIGSGKSTVCEIFRLLGVPVFHADDEAKKLYSSDENIMQELVQSFGKSILTIKGEIDKRHLALLIFNDKTALYKVNSIVHPAVEKCYNEWIQKNNNVQFSIIEAALLFESGFYKILDFTISVMANETLRIGRVMRRDGASIDEVRTRITNQVNDDSRIGLSSYLIFNDDKHLLIPQVLELYNKLTTLRLF